MMTGKFFGVHKMLIKIYEGLDVTDLLNIIKYEPPVPACLAGQVKGNFPGFLHKTDEERCCDQNTIIETVDGLKTIKEICELKYNSGIKSYNHDLECVEYKNISNWSIMTRKIDSWIKITTKSGKELIVTDNHKIFIENDKCYRESKYLKIGDKLNIS
jgi:intein/homing endonuclease